MHIDDLPKTVLVGHAAEREDLESVLNFDGFRWPALHVVAVSGYSRSVRILSPDPIEGESAPFPGPLGAREMAMELLRLATREARYGTRLSHEVRKGWEIRYGHVGATPVVVALATWV